MNARAAAADVRAQLVKAGIAEASFEAELLVREASGLTRAGFFATGCLSGESLNTLTKLVERRLQREPAAYISGHREFFGLNIAVSPEVLIPRPESELLVELALEELRAAPGSIVADVGTGSGCISAAIAVHAPQARIIATDVSRQALCIAQRNFATLSPQVHLIRSDLAAGIDHADIIVANLPYIPSTTVDDLEPEVRDWEPHLALDGGEDGLGLVRKLIDDCAVRLRPQLLALEVMAGQADEVSRYAEGLGAKVVKQKDLAGIERVVTARWA